MAGNIKGIMIEIDGNTQPLSNALKDLNKDIRAVDKELKNVDQALKLDPGNAEQVARKLELLEEKAGLAQQKVERLKEAQKQMDAQGVDKSSKEYQALTTEIAKAEGAYKDIQVQIERTGKSFEEVSQGSKQLQTFLEATGQSADDLTSILGSKLVDAIKSGQLGAAGYQTVLDKLATSFTGSKNNAEEFRKVLSSIDDGGSLDKVRQELEAIGKTNISGLGSEFDQINQKTASLDTELKQINQSLKLDPSSLDLCAQKQEVLSQAVQASEQKLQLLNQRFSELKANNVDLNDEEFRTLQREIANTESALSGYKSNLSDLENAQSRLNTYFEATGTSVRDFSNVLGSDLVAKIERGEASSQELATALDKIGASAIQNKGDIDRFKSALDGIDNGVSFDRIRSELDQLGTGFNEGEEDVNKFEEALNKIADGNAISALKDMGDMVSEAADGLGELASSATEAAETVESTQSQIQMSLGVTDEEAAAVADHVHNVWAQNFGETQEEVTEVMVNIQKAISDVNDSNIEDVTAKFMTLQQMGMDNEDAIRGVKSAMEAWGLSSEEALDLVTSGFQNIHDPANELGDIMGEYSPLMEQSGYSATEFLTVLKEGMDNGAYSVDKVADLIKEVGVRLSDGSIASAVTDLDNQFQGMGVNFEEVFTTMSESGASNKEIFQALVAEIGKLPSEADQAAAASALFGTQGEDAGLKVLNAVAGAGDEFSNYIGSANEAKEANETAVGTMQRHWEDLKLALAPIGEALATVANVILEQVIPAVEAFSKGLENIFNGEQNFDLSDMWNKISEGFDQLMETVREKFPEWKEAALEAIKNFVDGFLEGLPDLLSNVGDMGGKLIETLMEWLPKILEFGVQIIGTIVKSLIEHLPDLLSAAVQLIGKLLEGFVSGFPQFVQGIGELILVILAALGECAGSLIQAGIDIIGNILGGIGSAIGSIGEFFGNFFSGLWETVQPFFQPFIDGISTAWNGLWAGIQEGWAAISEWFMNIFGPLGETVGQAWNTFCTNISTAWNTAISGLQTIWDTVSGTIQAKWSEFCNRVQTAWNNFTAVIKNAWSELCNNIQSVWENISGTVQAKWNEFCNRTQTTWNNFTAVIKNTWSELWDKVQDIWDTVSGTIQAKWSEFCNRVQSIWNNFTAVIKNTWSQLCNNVQQFAQGMRDKVSDIVNGVKDSVSSAFNSAKDTAVQAWDNLKNKCAEIWDSVKQVVSDGVQRLKDLMNFNWELPHIALPHFSISGEFSLNPPSIPSISVDWYKKGGILTKPTIFGLNGNSLLGGGEAGPEAVLPIDRLNDFINNDETNSLLRQLIDLLSNQNIQVVMDTGQLVGSLVKPLDNQLGMRQKRMARQ